MAKYKVTFDKVACIGALACLAVDDLHWKDDNDGKVDLKNATYNETTNKWELIIGEEDYERMKESADVCPVTAIIVEKIE